MVPKLLTSSVMLASGQRHWILVHFQLQSLVLVCIPLQPTSLWWIK